MIRWPGPIGDWLHEDVPRADLAALSTPNARDDPLTDLDLIGIVRGWRQPAAAGSAETIWLRLAVGPVEVGSSLVYPPDVQLLWLGTVDDATYLVLAPAGSGSATDRADQYVVVLDDRRVRPIDQLELDRLREPLADAIRHRPSTPLDAIVERLGPLPEAGSAAFYAACLAERGIVGHLQIAWETVEPSQAVSVLGLRDVAGDPLRVKLATPSGEGPGEELEIRRQVVLDGERYLVLYPPFRTWLPGKPSPHHLAALGPSGVRALSGDVEIARVGRRLIEELELDRPDGRFRPLGALPSNDRARLVASIAPLVIESGAPTVGPSVLPPVPPPPPRPPVPAPPPRDISPASDGPTSTTPPAPGPAEPGTRRCPMCAAPTGPDFVFCENCGTKLPDAGRPTAQDRPPSPAPAPGDTPARCIGCGAGLDDPGAVCGACGSSRVGPPCPRCGQPVFGVDDDGERAPHFARLSWNTGWRQICERCGLAFMAAVQASELSVVEILPLDAVYSDLPDSFHHIPTVEITVRRQTFGRSGERLPIEARIELTVEEARAIVEQLSGPLGVLLQQKRWWVDNT